MKLREGATVITNDGEKVGTLQRLIVDRENRDVTHLVVEEGMMLARDSLVPVGVVARTETPSTIVLEPHADPDRFEPYTGQRRESMYRIGSSGLMPHPIPAVPPMPVPGDPVTPEAVPESKAIVEAGARVVAGDGRRLGKIEELIVDDDGIIDALVVRSGILWFRHRHVIPVGWIADVRRDTVHLSVPKEEARRGTESDIGQLPAV